PLGDALGAHLAGHARALVDVRRRRRGADRARGADVVRAVRHRPPREAVALDRAGEALAAGDTRHLRLVALLERLDRDRVAGVPALGVAELDQRAVRGDPGRLQVAGARPGELLLLDRAERELHGGVAVGLGRAHGDDRARARLDHRDRRDLPRLGVEQLGHAEL